MLLIERKPLPDLVASIKDGRLFGQAHRLAGWPLWKAFILEGTATDLAGSGMRREAIQGALIALTLYLGILLLRSQDPTETAQLMLFAARQGRSMATGSVPRPGRRPRGKARIQARVLQGLPGGDCSGRSVCWRLLAAWRESSKPIPRAWYRCAVSDKPPQRQSAGP